MRHTWLGNEQKNYPWHQTKLFSYSPVQPKKDYLESKYASDWRGMMLVSNCEDRSRSPIDKERHGSLTGRTLEPDLQDSSPIGPRKKLLKPPLNQSEKVESKKKFEKNGKDLLKNAYSRDNVVVSPGLRESYRERSLTPEPGKEVGARKRSCERAVKDRIGDLSKDALPPRTRVKVKSDFVSQVVGLAGSVKVEMEDKGGNWEKYRERGLIRSEWKEARQSKKRPEAAVEQWRSSLDIIKHVVNSKTYY